MGKSTDRDNHDDWPNCIPRPHIHQLKSEWTRKLKGRLEQALKDEPDLARQQLLVDALWHVYESERAPREPQAGIRYDLLTRTLHKHWEATGRRGTAITLTAKELRVSRPRIDQLIRAYRIFIRSIPAHLRPPRDL